jgi:succinoglycan biosynthesis protein ExoV
MQIYYWRSPNGNFGDDLNNWLWDRLLPGLRESHPDTLLCGVGTVLGHGFIGDQPFLDHSRRLVIGSGTGYGESLDLSDSAIWDVRCVRGPLTAQKLGLPEAMGIIDPAVLVSDFPEFQSLPKQYNISFVPHWESELFGIWPLVSAAAGIHHISPNLDSKEVIRQIASSELIIAESMHAAILADCFNIPWVAVSSSRHINQFKWEDWAKTVDVTYDPLRIPVSSRLEAQYKKEPFWSVWSKSIISGPEKSKEVVTKTRHNSVKEQLKMVLAGPAIRGLREAALVKPQLSQAAMRKEKKERLYAVLAQVKMDYNL